MSVLPQCDERVLREGFLGAEPRIAAFLKANREEK
jgi:hypothetical protein